MSHFLKSPVYRWEKKHANLLNEYINLLNEQKIRYFILRNFEGLPELNESKDVDIIVEPGFYKQAAEALLQVFKKYNVKNYYVVKYEKVYCWIGMNIEENFSIHIDLIEGYRNKGFEIFDFKTLYDHTEKYKNFRVLNNAYDIVMLLLYKVIGSKELKLKYREKISNGYKKDKLAINQLLYTALGDKQGSIVVECLNNNNFEEIIDMSKTISKKSKKIAFLKKPIYTSINIISFLLEKIYRIGICPNKYRKFIAVQAPDGTGKTTFINNLRVSLSEMFVTDISKMNVYHFRPSILPNLGALGEKTGLMEQDKDFTNPHRNKPSNPLSSFIRIGYYWMDYFVGGNIIIRKDVQFDSFSIFDRYIYDFIVDPVRSKINLSKFIRKIYSKLVPQPQIVFILTTDAETIYSRKQELTLPEIKRQLNEFESLLRSNKRFVALDASQSPDKIVQDAMMILVEKYTRKV